jgi:hypothetical protein
MRLASRIWLRNDFSSLVADSGASRVVKKATTPKLSGVVSTDADNQEQLRQVIDFYHETLKQSPEALAYLSREAWDRELGGYR